MNKILYINKISKINSHFLVKYKKIQSKNSIFKIFELVFFLKLYLFLFLPYISKEEENNEIQTNYSYIELTVKGPGIAKVFYKNEENANCKGIIPPDEIQINENETTPNPEMEQYLTNEENNVKLIWINKKINTLHCLFYDCLNITYVDFSHFNSTFVESVSQLFIYCKSLITVNFNNFDSSNVKDMYNMFKNCTSLKSIDLSNFNTSKVTSMHYMFYACFALEYINLSQKFDITYFYINLIN